MAQPGPSRLPVKKASIYDGDNIFTAAMKDDEEEEEMVQLDRRFPCNSKYYDVLVAPYTPPPQPPQHSTPSPQLSDVETCASMIDWSRNSDANAHTNAVAAAENIQRDASTGDLSEPLYTPFGPWAWAAGQTIEDVQTLKFLGTGLMGSGNIKRGTIANREITYISKSWPLATRDDWYGFHSELALYKSEKYLKDLQGDVIPRMIGVHVLPGAVSFAMEPPHPVFWMEAYPDMPTFLKERIIKAYEKIHAKGVLHNDPEPRHMLIGADGRVTIIDFQMSKALIPDASIGLEKAEPFEFALEIRKVKFKLDYRDARIKEHDKIIRAQQRLLRSKKRRALLKAGESPDETSKPEDKEIILEDDIVNPPVHYPEFERTWSRPLDRIPTRYVIPGHTPAEVEIEVERFMLRLPREPPWPIGLAPPPGHSAVQPATPAKSALQQHQSSATTGQKRKADAGSEPDGPVKRARQVARRFLPLVEDRQARVLTPEGNVKMWYSDLPDDVEDIPRLSKPHRKYSVTGLLIRRQNIERCHRRRLPHVELLRRGVVQMTKTVQARAMAGLRGSIDLGKLKRWRDDEEDELEADRLSKRRKERYMDIKELKNEFIALKSGVTDAGPLDGPSQIPLDDPDFELCLRVGEHDDIPEGPRIMTRAEFERHEERQRLQPGKSKAPGGILKASRPNKPPQVKHSEPFYLDQFYGDSDSEAEIEEALAKVEPETPEELERARSIRMMQNLDRLLYPSKYANVPPPAIVDPSEQLEALRMLFQGGGVSSRNSSSKGFFRWAGRLMGWGQQR